LQNVFVIPKDREYLDEMKTKLGKSKNIAVIGAGFIGVELSDELTKHGCKVTLIEKMPHILNLAFDEEIAEQIHEMLIARGVNIVAGKGISKVIGNEKVEAIEFEVIILEEVRVFLKRLDQKTSSKVIFNLKKAQMILDPELFKKLKDEIWEFRTKYSKNNYRLSAFWDKSDNKNTMVICTHGSIKKSKKTPKTEIDKAHLIMKRYFSDECN